MQRMHHRLVRVTETDRHDQNEPSMQEPQQVQQYDDHDRNTCQPKYDVA
jgi:hypothetical protein